MSLVNTPLDILMEICRDLDLLDSLHLIATSTTFTPILLERYFWSAALHRLEYFHRQPPPYSVGLDISSLPLTALKGFAIQAYKLKRALSSADLRPVSLQTIELQDSPRVLIPIQGTRLILTVSVSCIACWDTVSAQCVCVFHHETEPLGVDTWFPVEISPLWGPGSCSIGMIYARSSTSALELAVISFDYRNLSAATVSKTFSTVWTPPDAGQYRVCQVAVGVNIIAAILKKESTVAILLVCTFDNQVISDVQFDSRCTDPPRFILVKEDFYITQQYLEGVADIIHVQKSGQADALDFHIHASSIALPSSTDEPTIGIGHGSSHLRFPEYGVMNVTHRTAYYQDDGNTEIDTVHFWTAEHDRSTLTPGPLSVYAHPKEILATAVGSSATYCIIADIDGDLGLVQYLPHPTPHVVFKPLHVPEVNLSRFRMWTIALDDRLGTLYVGHVPRNGLYTLTVVSYS
ncbi:hypothetical protein DFH06DRAFT_1312631 [Mycena polygramma]|nr:hypothetical protein DFH06DRAFT_1312631 [Mycena polygramma]